MSNKENNEFRNNTDYSSKIEYWSNRLSNETDKGNYPQYARALEALSHFTNLQVQVMRALQPLKPFIETELQKDYRNMVSDMRAMEIEAEDKELRRRESKLAILEFYKK